jgi:hypothetical protein
MSIAVEDWDDLAAARRRRNDREAAAAPEAESETEAVAAAPVAAPRQRNVDDYDDGYGEKLHLPLCLAAGNVGIWLLAHLSGVVELIGVSFAASVGMLLAAYVLREWQRDRSALICLAGATPILITIFSLLA